MHLSRDIYLRIATSSFRITFTREQNNPTDAHFMRLRQLLGFGVI